MEYIYEKKINEELLICILINTLTVEDGTVIIIK